MAKGIENNFADNWQKASSSKDSYSARIHQQGEMARATTQAIEKAKINSAQNASLNDPAKAASEKPAPTVKELPNAVQGARVETQEHAQAVKSRELAEQNFQNVRRDAQNLKSLEKNVKDPATADTALRDAVAQKPQSQAADLGRNLNPLLQHGAAQLAARDASKNVARDKNAVENRPQTKGAEKPAREGDAEKAAAPKLAQSDASQPQQAASMEAARAVAQTEQKGEAAVDTEETREGDDDTRTEDGDGKSTVYSARAGGREKSRELGALLGGFAGGNTDAGNGEASDAPAAIAADTKPEPLPETDPNFHVFNEFDSEAVGPHTIKGKAQVYSRSVEKKLREIASFDVELGKKMQSLSERIVGELSDGLKDELKTAKFLNSVYGGVIG